MKKMIYGAEEFSFGGSLKGGITSLKAKIADMFSDDSAYIVHYAVLSGQLLERIEKLQAEIKLKKGEYQKDVAQIPIGVTAQSLWCNGKLVKDPEEIATLMVEMQGLLRARETVIYPQFKIFLSQFAELLHGILSDKDITTKDLSELIGILNLSKNSLVGEKEFIGNVTTGVQTNKMYNAEVSYIGYSHKRPPANGTSDKIEAFTREQCLKLIPICHDIASLNSDWFSYSNSRSKGVQKTVGKELNDVLDLLIKLDRMSHPKALQLIGLYNGVIDLFHDSFGALAYASNETGAAVARLMEMSARRWY